MSAGVKLTVENHLDWFNHELNHCIRFEKVNETVARTLDRKLHVVDGSGCWSYLGAIPQRVLKFGIKKTLFFFCQKRKSGLIGLTHQPIGTCSA